MSRAILAMAIDVREMADFLGRHRPECKSIVIYRADRDLLCRKPEEAELAGFTFKDGEPYWGRYQLRTDKGVGG